MIDEQKQLLLKDLCARLPYGLKVKCERYPFPVTVLYAGNVDEVKFKETGGIEHIDLIKPYLRPMSSMTEREKEVFQYIAGGKILDNCNCIVRNGFGLYYDNIAKIGDWLNEHHFDYRGLIPMGLALEAPEDMYKTE